MSTYTQILYQIVYSTWNREPILLSKNRSRLFGYIDGVLRKSKCHLYQMNGVNDHVHILTHIHPSMSLADLVKNVKLSSNEFIKMKRLFPGFHGWQEGYAAFTYSFDQKGRLIDYIKNQEAHHRIKTFKEELIELLNEHEIEFDPKFLL